NATVGMPYARPVIKHSSSWSRFVTAYTLFVWSGFVSGVATGARLVPQSGQCVSQSFRASCAPSRSGGATGPWVGQVYAPSPWIDIDEAAGRLFTPGF